MDPNDTLQPKALERALNWCYETTYFHNPSVDVRVIPPSWIQLGSYSPAVALADVDTIVGESCTNNRSRSFAAAVSERRRTASFNSERVEAGLSALPTVGFDASSDGASLGSILGEPVEGIESLSFGSFQAVVLGGTFDRLHMGHKVLLSMAAVLTSDYFEIGITCTASLRSCSFHLHSLSTSALCVAIDVAAAIRLMPVQRKRCFGTRNSANSFSHTMSGRVQ